MFPELRPSRARRAASVRSPTVSLARMELTLLRTVFGARKSRSAICACWSPSPEHDGPGKQAYGHARVPYGAGAGRNLCLIAPPAGTTEGGMITVPAVRPTRPGGASSRNHRGGVDGARPRTPAPARGERSSRSARVRRTRSADLRASGQGQTTAADDACGGRVPAAVGRQPRRRRTPPGRGADRPATGTERFPRRGVLRLDG